MKRFQKILFIICVVFGALQIPWVQTKCVNSANLFLAPGMHIAVEGVRGLFPIYLNISRVELFKNKQSYIRGDQIQIRLSNLWKGKIKNLDIKEILISNVSGTDPYPYTNAWVKKIWILGIFDNIQIRKIIIKNTEQIYNLFVKKNDIYFDISIKSLSPERLFGQLSLKGVLCKNNNIKEGKFFLQQDNLSIDGLYNLDLSVLASEINILKDNKGILKINNMIDFKDQKSIKMPLIELQYNNYEWKGSAYFTPKKDSRWDLLLIESKKDSVLHGIFDTKNMSFHGGLKTPFFEEESQINVRLTQGTLRSNLTNKMSYARVNYNLKTRKISGHASLKLHQIQGKFLSENLSVNINLFTKNSENEPIYDVNFEGATSKLIFGKNTFKDIKFMGSINSKKFGKIKIKSKYYENNVLNILNIDASSIITPSQISFHLLSPYMNIEGFSDYSQLYLKKGFLKTSAGKIYSLKRPCVIYPILSKLEIATSSSSIVVDQWHYKDLPLGQIKNIDLKDIIDFLGIERKITGKIEGIFECQKGHLDCKVNLENFDSKTTKLTMNYVRHENNIEAKGGIFWNNIQVFNYVSTVKYFDDFSKIETKGKASGMIDILPISNMFLQEETVQGNLTTHLEWSSKGKVYSIDGKFSLNKIAFENDEYGMFFMNGSANGYFNNDGVVLEKFLIYDCAKKQGNIAGSGQIFFDQNKNNSIQLMINKFQIMQSPKADIVTSGNVIIDKKFKISGNVKIEKGAINLDKLFPKKKNFSIIDPRVKKRKKSPNYSFIENLHIAVHPGFIISGFGLNSKWKGDITLSGQANQIIPIGNMSATEGEFILLGKSAKLSEGEIMFDEKKAFNPKVLLIFRKKIEPHLLYAKLLGRINTLNIVFNADDPSLKQEDVLSYWLFSTTAKNLSPAQALQLGTALTQISQDAEKGKISNLQRITNMVDIKKVQRFHEINAKEILSVGKDFNKTRVSLETDLNNINSSRINLEQQITPSLQIRLSALNNSADNARDGNSGLELGLSYRKNY